MNPIADEIMISRSVPSEDALTSLRNTGMLRSSRAQDLIDEIFGVIPAVYGNPDKRKTDNPAHIRNNDQPTPSWIYSEFYKHHYCEVSMRRDYAGYRLSLNQFMSEITSPNFSNNRNKVFFLKGDVGSGKTALINHLITKYGIHIYEKNDIWFLRLNVDAIRNHVELSPERFLQDLNDKLITTVNKSIDRGYYGISDDEKISKLRRSIEILKASFSKSELSIDKQYAIKEFIVSVSKILEKSILLIFDNIDFLVHERDRQSFLMQRESVNSPHLNTINSIVKFFLHSGNILNEIGANILFVLRGDTYQILKNNNILVSSDGSGFEDNKRLFTLDNPSWTDVINERASLLEKCLTKVSAPGVAHEVQEHLLPIISGLRDSERNRSLFFHLEPLSVYGLRGVLRFFKDYAWYPIDVTP